MADGNATSPLPLTLEEPRSRTPTTASTGLVVVENDLPEALGRAAALRAAAVAGARVVETPLRPVPLPPLAEDASPTLTEALECVLDRAALEATAPPQAKGSLQTLPPPGLTSDLQRSRVMPRPQAAEAGSLGPEAPRAPRSAASGGSTAARLRVQELEQRLLRSELETERLKAESRAGSGAGSYRSGLSRTARREGGLSLPTEPLTSKGTEGLTRHAMRDEAIARMRRHAEPQAAQAAGKAGPTKAAHLQCAALDPTVRPTSAPVAKNLDGTFEAMLLGTGTGAPAAAGDAGVSQPCVPPEGTHGVTRGVPTSALSSRQETWDGVVQAGALAEATRLLQGHHDEAQEAFVVGDCMVAGHGHHVVGTLHAQGHLWDREWEAVFPTRFLEACAALEDMRAEVSSEHQSTETQGSTLSADLEQGRTLTATQAETAAECDHAASQLATLHVCV